MISCVSSRSPCKYICSFSKLLQYQKAICRVGTEYKINTRSTSIRFHYRIIYAFNRYMKLKVIIHLGRSQITKLANWYHTYITKFDPMKMKTGRNFTHNFTYFCVFVRIVNRNVYFCTHEIKYNYIAVHLRSFSRSMLLQISTFSYKY